MHFSNKFAVSALCAALLVDATPISIREINDVVDAVSVLGGQTMRVHQVHNPGQKYKNYKASGAAAIARALNKYNVQLSADLLASLGVQTSATSNTTSNDTVTATPVAFDREYLSPVSIGTPPQTLNLDFDTGSADLWVFSSDTPSAQTSGQVEYKPSSSSSATRLTGATWGITYGDGSSSSGIVYKDKVSIGPVTFGSQAIESASKVSSSFTSDTASSGLLGLAFDTLNTVKPTAQKTFFDNVMANLASPLFTANLKKAAPGNYNFGFIDPTEFTGQISYTPVDKSKGFWGFTATGFSVGTGALNATNWNAIADTGTSLLLLPSDIATTYWLKVPGAVVDASAGGWTFPCSAVLPDFTFAIGSYRGKIPGTFINYTSLDTTTCYGGIQADTGIGFSIFGDVALKAQFVVFDGGNLRLGWAAKPL